MSPALARLLAMEQSLERIGYYVAAERIRKAIVAGAFEEKMEREGIAWLL